MKKLSVLVSLALLAMLVAPAHGQTPTPDSNPPPVPTAMPAATPAPAKPKRLLYVAPPASKGSRTDGTGGSRSGGVKLPSIYVLSPNHIGLTTRAQPSLFWFQSGPAGTRFELTVVEPRKPKPLLQVAAQGADTPGIHRISLARHHVSLAPGIVYRWTVALVPDRSNRSQDMIASGTIQLVEADAKLDSALAGAEGLTKAALYAGKGYWYDALEVVTNEIDAAPKDKSLRLLRASLLDQAGLKEAAESDRK